jgi:hypothetical protein
MKLRSAVLAAIALAAGCTASALDTQVPNNGVEGLLDRRSTMTVEVPFYTVVSSLRPINSLLLSSHWS